jgi:hypothetical protein
MVLRELPKFHAYCQPDENAKALSRHNACVQDPIHAVVYYFLEGDWIQG